jgi:hypothetical protein
VDDALYAISNYRIPVIFVRSASGTASEFSAVGRVVGHGSSVVTVDVTSTTSINANVIVWITTGGTIGTSWQYKVSLNGGTTYGNAISVTTATSISITLGTGALVIDFATGTVVTGELITVTANVILEGSYGSLDSGAYPGNGTASATLTAQTFPNNDYEIRIRFLNSIALGTTGGQYQYSLDNGRHWSVTQSLGVSLVIVVPGTGGASVTLGTSAQTIAAGAELAWRCVAPASSLEELTAAMGALLLNPASWRLCDIASVIDAETAAALDSMFESAFQNGQERAWISSWRLPIAGESDATYQASYQANAVYTARGSAGYGSLTAGDCKVTIVGSNYNTKRRVSMVVAARQASVTMQTDIARPTLGALPGVQLTDTNGNPDCHDEALYPGLDDLGAITLRSWTDYTGAYVNNPRLWISPGQDLEMIPHRLVFNAGVHAVRQYFARWLSADLFANATTGKLRTSDRKMLEQGSNRAASDAVITTGAASAARVTISSEDNLIESRPPTLHFDFQTVPKIYVKAIVGTASFVPHL